MKRVYLDYNITNKLQSAEKNTSNKWTKEFSYLNSTECELVCSYAHCEEILGRDENFQYSEIRFFKNLFKEIIKVKGSAYQVLGKLYQKASLNFDPISSIGTTYNTCKKYYTRDLIKRKALKKFNFENTKREFYHQNFSQDYGNMSFYNEINVWSSPILQDLIIRYLEPELTKYIANFSFSSLKNNYASYSFEDLQAIFECTYQILNCANYNYDKNADLVASGIYDTTHILCAKECDGFITCDKHLAKKAEAIYSYLGITTKVFVMPTIQIKENSIQNEDKLNEFLSDFKKNI